MKRLSFEQVRDMRASRSPFLKDLIAQTVRGATRALEIGTGVGFDYCELSRLVDSYGVDFTFENVDRTRSNAKLAGAEARVVCADAMMLPFPGNTFDAAYSFGVIHHVPSAEQAIDEVHRVLKPNGRFGLMLYHRWLGTYVSNTHARLTNRETEEGQGAIVHTYTSKELGRLLGKFTIERMWFGQQRGTGKYLIERIYWKIQRALPSTWRDFALIVSRKEDR